MYVASLVFVILLNYDVFDLKKRKKNNRILKTRWICMLRKNEYGIDENSLKNIDKDLDNSLKISGIMKIFKNILSILKKVISCWT